MHRGKIYYDASCGVCSAGKRRWEKAALRGGFVFEPIQSAEGRKLFNLAEGQTAGEVKLVLTDGQTIGGIDALIHVWRYIWWARPMWLIACIPGVRRFVLRPAYLLFARNGMRFSAACGLQPDTSTTSTPATSRPGTSTPA